MVVIYSAYRCKETWDKNRFMCIFYAASLKIFVSLSTLCDNLRRERDRAVSDLADALRNLDDMRKQKNEAARELKELKCVFPLHILFARRAPSSTLF